MHLWNFILFLMSFLAHKYKKSQYLQKGNKIFIEKLFIKSQPTIQDSI
jgi:hypothetical protein